MSVLILPGAGVRIVYYVPMQSKPLARNLAFRSGLAMCAFGLFAIVLLLVYDHGLEDTLPFALYLFAAVAIPAGLAFCLGSVAVNLIRGRLRRPQSSPQPPSGN